MTIEGEGPAWFEAALARLLTMRVWLCAAHERPHPEERASRASRRMRHTKNDDTTSRSRGAWRPSFSIDSPLIENRGRREGRVSADTHGPRATKSTRQNHRFSRNNRPSLRNGFNGFLR